jgi:hypothetical protein
MGYDPQRVTSVNIARRPDTGLVEAMVTVALDDGPNAPQETDRVHLGV